MSWKKKPKKGHLNAHDDIRGNLDFMGMSPRYKFLAIKLIWLHHLNEPKNIFKSAIEATPLLKDAYKEGLQALGNYSKKVTPSDTKKCEGSVDIDFAVKNVEVNSVKPYAQACRWDYAIGYDGKVYFIEVHSAETSQVTQVLRKHTWLKDFLVAQAPELNKLDKQFYWISSKGNDIVKRSSEARQLAQSGITLVRQLNL
ncbi:MAG: hypothetical protein NW214_16405 [Pseudanabaenaceae cyanobacterium bins.39]|nr:hypothetical protein [Pseudanabaenaceae cyanobacterium bins.39]